MSVISVIADRARGAALRWLFPGAAVNLYTDQKIRDRQARILVARDYYDGSQNTPLTKRQKEWLDTHGGKIAFSMNVCALVVDSVVERLEVTGFKCRNDADSAAVWGWWQHNRMDTMQIDIHRGACKDGTAYVIAEWNAEEGRPDYY